MTKKKRGRYRPVDPSDPRSPDHPDHRERWLEFNREIGRVLAERDLEMESGKTRRRVMTEHERALVTGGEGPVAGVVVRTENDVDREARKGTPARKYRILAHRGSASVLGAATAWAKSNGRVVEYDSRELAEMQARKCNARCTSTNVRYTVEEV